MMRRIACWCTIKDGIYRGIFHTQRAFSYYNVLGASINGQADSERSNQANSNSNKSNVASNTRVMYQQDDLCKDGSLVTSSKLLDRLRSTRTLSEISGWNGIFQYLYELHSKKHYIHVLEIGLEVLSKGKNAPFPLYAAVLKSLLAELEESSCNDNNPVALLNLYETAYFLIDQMCRLNYKIPVVILTQLANNILLTGNSLVRYKFQLLMQTMIANGAADGKFLSQIISMYISNGEIEGLLNFIRQVNVDNPSKSINIPYHVNESMLLALIKIGDTHFALEVIKYLETLGPVCSRTWGLFISHAARMKDHEAVTYAWKNALITGSVVVDDATYRMILDLATQNGHVALAKWSFLRLRRRNELLGIEDDYNNVVLLFSRMIEAYANQPLEKEEKNVSVVHALSLISRMRHEAAMLKLKHLPSLVSFISRSPNIKNHLERIRNLLNDDVIVKEVKTLLMNITLASVLKKTDQPRQLLLMFEFFNSQYDVIPNDDTILCLLEKAYEENDGTILYEVLNYKDKFSIIDNRRILEITILALRRLNSYKESEIYVDRLLQLGPLRPYMKEDE